MERSQAARNARFRLTIALPCGLAASGGVLRIFRPTIRPRFWEFRKRESGGAGRAGPVPAAS
jgi:hypothetical protein